MTPFARILAELERECPGFETAVFFDDQGEAIDFHTRSDPYGARLIAAYHVVLFMSAHARLEWLGAGRTTQLEIFAQRRESVTMTVGDGYYVSVVVRAGSCGDALLERLVDVAEKLRAEAGV
jgi:predicted regulator of Ras-like GTPase activity (Roadblock/LC7/MglB family)